ncbi:MAG: pyridoxal phosphate-dependent aminotransferase [Lachnospiraceae bacterium]|nr:pyridoxal phosphate-dependent aminotransferase [Lachnospiraceae bacterium]MDD6191712.1 pyridoxal phosphate-dependent aminotransferase [Lachnospiraceae bacterium]MDY4792675.1 MalY/PatB family protein [Pararoseburia sp.]
MKYDFDKVVNRRDTYSLKWDVKENELPMWVADMDFETAPEIINAIEKRAAHGVFGYTDVPKEWYQAICNWWEMRHHFQMQQDWLMFCTGVIPAISSIVRKLTTPNENVVIQTPVYNIFFNSIVNNGCRVLESPLVYENGLYRIDWEDLEEKLANPQTTLMILCNPQNPAGIIWDQETLEKIGDLCAKHHVTVIADEIHCDLTDPGKEYIPFASVSGNCRENSITCIAPTKTFNIAGLQTAAIMVPNPQLRYKVNRAINTDEVAEPNVFAVTAAIAAYQEGAEWLDELRAYIYENKQTVKQYIQEHIPEITVVDSEATYLLWLDCSKITQDTDIFLKKLRKETGLFLSLGSIYGGNGKCFARMNLACPRATVLDGLHRLEKGVH